MNFYLFKCKWLKVKRMYYAALQNGALHVILLKENWPFYESLVSWKRYSYRTDSYVFKGSITIYVSKNNIIPT